MIGMTVTLVPYHKGIYIDYFVDAWTRYLILRDVFTVRARFPFRAC